MNNSSNSIFHFTDSFEIIKSILSDKFYGSYCKESINYNGKKAPVIIPMISFCDIPLKSVSQKTKYGKYGIGMSKRWAINNRLNPVLYLEKNSSLAKTTIESFNGNTLLNDYLHNEIDVIGLEMDEVGDKIKQGQLPKEELSKVKNKVKNLTAILKGLHHSIYSLYFTKHFSDDLERNGRITRNYKFYDEREWRYVPDSESDLAKYNMGEQQYKEWRENNKIKPILESVYLEFKPHDIEFVIVEKKSEKKRMAEYIKTLHRFNESQKENLLTKIISFQELKEDI
jgi:hypothetical protein